MNKPIILIGGTPGAGKSTLANRLSCTLDLDHRIGVGFIRAAIQSESDIKNEPELFSFTFRSSEPIKHLNWQAKRLEPAVRACIDRARREGTSLVIEGTHLIPSIYSRVESDLYLALLAGTEAEHRRRIDGPSHTKRLITDADFRNARLIDDYYRAETERFKVRTFGPVLDIESIIRLLG